LIGAVRKVLLKIDPQKPPHNITALEDLVDATVIRDRYAMTLVASFAIVALMLALLGIYGVLAFYVRQRIQEIGIRMALGAQQSEIATWIAKQGARLILFGVAAGLLAALAFTRLLRGVLYEVSPLDFWSLTAAALALSVAALAATWIPARRASKIDPSIALRYE
jgi:putative ABC transport system permease protein